MRNTILTFSNSTTVRAKLDATRMLNFAIKVPDTEAATLRLIDCHFSKFVANVIAISSPISYDNTRLRFTSDGGATWWNVVIPEGRYDIDSFNAAVSALTETLWTDPSDPGIVFGGNPSTGRVYVKLDNTKLNQAGQLGVDFGSAACQDIGQFLGFTSKPAIIGNNVVEAEDQPMFNLVGDSINLVVEGFGPLSVVDGAPGSVIASVPMILHSSASNEFVYPMTPVITPHIQLTNCPPMVNQFSVRFESTRTIERGSQSFKVPVIFIEGGCYVSMEFTH